MKALIVIYDQELQNELDFILRSNKIEYYTRFDGVFGKGRSGLKMGDSIGPGTNRMYCIVLEDTTAQKLSQELKNFKNQKLKKKGIQIFTLPVESVI